MYNIRHLRYFVDAAQTSSLAAVARQHRVSQSAVSQAIRSLENALGFAVCHHERKTFRLTENGKAILGKCNEVLAAAEALRDAAQGLEEGHGGILNVASTNTLTVGFLPNHVRAMASRYPNVRVSLRIANSEVIKSWLLAGECDMGILVDDGKLRDALHCETIATGRYVLCKRAGGGGDIFNEGLVVTRQERSEVQFVLRALRQKFGRVPPICCEIISWQAIKNYVATAGGYGVVPDYALDAGQGGGIAQADVPFAMPEYALVAATTRRAPSRNAGLLLEMLRRDPL